MHTLLEVGAFDRYCRLLAVQVSSLIYLEAGTITRS